MCAGNVHNSRGNEAKQRMGISIRMLEIGTYNPFRPRDFRTFISHNELLRWHVCGLPGIKVSVCASSARPERLGREPMFRLGIDKCEKDGRIPNNQSVI
jgi:hypothetical protein